MYGSEVVEQCPVDGDSVLCEPGHPMKAKDRHLVRRLCCSTVVKSNSLTVS